MTLVRRILVCASAIGLGAATGCPPAPPINTLCSAFAPGCASDLGPQGPIDLVAADLNGDGAVDLAILNSESNDVSVLLNTGPALFMPSINYPVSAGRSDPREIQAVDMDGDGDVDLVVLIDVDDRSHNDVAILLNNNDGTFAPPRLVEFVGQGAFGLTLSISTPWAVLAVDLTGDGAPDLVVGGGGIDRAIAVALNNGDATFGGARFFDAVEVFGPRAIAAGDFDGDGDNDLALADDDNELIALLTNLGAGVFGPPVTVALGTEPIAIASADLDGDGDLDLAVAARERPTFRDTVEIVHNNGPAGFSTVASIEIEFAFLTALVVADLNGDGAVDVAVADSVFGCVNVLLNTGGAFAVSGTIAVGDDPEGLAAADLDGDGDFDLATVNRESNNGSILINDGVGNFTLGG